MDAPAAPEAVPAHVLNPRRWLALAVICAGELMIVLDGTIVTVALPQIKEGLDFSDTGLAWTLNAYLLTFGGLLLLAGRAADLIGPRRLFVSGLGIFTIASLLCGIATEAWMLVAARALQGVGGAIITAVALALLVINFPQPHERAKAMGIWTFVAAGGGSIGVTLGGVLTDALDWRWIFLVNLPVGIVAIIMTMRSLAPDPTSREGTLDVAGAVLATGASTLLVSAFVGVESAGWGSARTIGLLAGALVMIGAFVVVERRVAHPLLPAGVFRSRNLTAGCVVSVLTIIGLFGWFFIGTLYLQRVLGLTPLKTGLTFLPATLLLGGMSMGPSAKLVRRFGPKPPLIVGTAMTVVGLALMARAPVGGRILVDVMPAMILIGIGIGISFMPLFLLALSEVSETEAGVSSGVLTTSQQIGGALGIAILVAIAAARTEAVGADATAALNAGYHAALWSGAAMSALAIPVALWAFRGGRDVAGAAHH
jgi:EmrB/QacA subfamily drug resistance transporter